MLGSASYLGHSLVCTHGTPVADLLAHSPPLLLIIDRVDKNHHVNAADESIVLVYPGYWISLYTHTHAFVRRTCFDGCDRLSPTTTGDSRNYLQPLFLRRENERDLLHKPIVIHVTLPHLRWFGFQGDIAYLEVLLPRITRFTTSDLKKLRFFVFNLSSPSSSNS
jgi:hypothetical protein